MAKASVKYRSSTSFDNINLEDYGHEDKKWDELTEKEQIEVKDSLREDVFVEITIECDEDF